MVLGEKGLFLEWSWLLRVAFRLTTGRMAGTPCAVPSSTPEFGRLLSEAVARQRRARLQWAL